MTFGLRVFDQSIFIAQFLVSGFLKDLSYQCSTERNFFKEAFRLVLVVLLELDL